jgi:hypothetical protein
LPGLLFFVWIRRFKCSSQERTYSSKVGVCNIMMDKITKWTVFPRSHSWLFYFHNLKMSCYVTYNHVISLQYLNFKLD